MISSKHLALGLLLSSPIALARVQLNTQIEVDRPTQQSKQTISTEIQLDGRESNTVVYNSDEVCIETCLLAEKENLAHVRYFVRVKNAEGAFELVATPELLATYGDTASVTFGETIQGKKVNSLALTLKATKI
jgi:hypothetical protein